MKIFQERESPSVESSCTLLENHEEYKITRSCAIMVRNNVGGYRHPGASIVDFFPNQVLVAIQNFTESRYERCSGRCLVPLFEDAERDLCSCVSDNDDTPISSIAKLELIKTGRVAATGF